MANRRFDRDWTFGPRIVRVYGSFATNSASNPVASSVKGFLFGYAPNSSGVMSLPTPLVKGLTTTPGIVHTGTGTYTITMEDPYIDLLSAVASLQLATPAAQDAQIGPVTNLGSSTAAPVITIVTYNTNSGAAVDIAANANNRVNFRFAFRDSTAQFVKP